MDMKAKEINKYVRLEILLLIMIGWLGLLFSGTFNNKKEENKYSEMIVAENNPEDEISAKLTIFIEFVNNNKTGEAKLNKEYINQGLLYLSGVLNAIIKNHYSGNTDMNNQKNDLLKINAKILNNDSLIAENLRKSLILSSKIISKIQSKEFPDLDEAVNDLGNSAREIDLNESSEILKYRTADFFEKSSNIFIAMAIIKAQRNNEVRDRFYGIRST
ncbi:MAG TPA: hypothetical protein VLB50_07080 [Ignavibacteriaceae bacterium]|nr:hypothetical protein [Ignavibacteriaceae bacterium]